MHCEKYLENMTDTLLLFFPRSRLFRILMRKLITHGSLKVYTRSFSSFSIYDEQNQLWGAIFYHRTLYYRKMHHITNHAISDNACFFPVRCFLNIRNVKDDQFCNSGGKDDRIQRYFVEGKEIQVF